MKPVVFYNSLDELVMKSAVFYNSFDALVNYIS